MTIQCILRYVKYYRERVTLHKAKQNVFEGRRVVFVLKMDATSSEYIISLKKGSVRQKLG